LVGSLANRTTAAEHLLDKHGKALKGVVEAVLSLARKEG